MLIKFFFDESPYPAEKNDRNGVGLLLLGRDMSMRGLVVLVSYAGVGISYLFLVFALARIGNGSQERVLRIQMISTMKKGIEYLSL